MEEKITKYLNEDTFEKFIVQIDKPMLLYFWAEWQRESVKLAPTLERVAKEFKDEIFLGSLNINECPNISKYYNIKDVPTVVFLKNGNIMTKEIGAKSWAVYRSIIENILN